MGFPIAGCSTGTLPWNKVRPMVVDERSPSHLRLWAFANLYTRYTRYTCLSNFLLLHFLKRKTKHTAGSWSFSPLVAHLQQHPWRTVTTRLRWPCCTPQLLRLKCLSARSKISSMLSISRLKFFRSWLQTCHVSNHACVVFRDMTFLYQQPDL